LIILRKVADHREGGHSGVEGQCPNCSDDELKISILDPSCSLGRYSLEPIQK